MKEVEELSFGDSATGASERKRHPWVGKLIAVLIVVVLVVVCASAWAWEARLRHIIVFVNGRQAEISVGTTAKQLLKDHDDFGTHPGRLLAVDGSVIKKYGGHPAELRVDGSVIDPADWGNTRFSGNADISVKSGGDVAEGHAIDYAPIPYTVSVDIKGSVIQMVKTRGKDGKREIWVGDISKKRITKRVIAQPVDAQIVGVSPRPQGHKVIALTFDDGPSGQYTAPILDILKQKGVKATFFDVGQYSVQYPALEKRMVAEGHEVASHSNTHPFMPKMKRDALRAEITAGFANMKKASGVSTRMMRSPYGSFTVDQWKDVYDLIDYNVLWSIDTEDWRRPGAQAIHDAVLNHAYNGAVVLMHDGGGNRDQDIQALPGIIDDLKAQGYEFVTISGLLKLAGISAAPLADDGGEAKK